MRATRVSPGNTGLVWPQVEGFIKSAFEAGIGDDTEATVVAMVHRGDAQLWVAHNGAGIKGAAITRIAVVPTGKKICFCVACGGIELAGWEHTIGEIERFAKQENCDVVRMSGRAGWRIYKKRGYREPYVILEKAL